MIPRFSSQEERLSFFEQAKNDGIYLRMKDGVPCAVVEPEPCLNKATVIHVRNEHGMLMIEPSLCQECAEKVSKLYEK